MKLKLLTLLSALFIAGAVNGQIFFQGFESSGADNWGFSTSPATYNTSGDVWAVVSSLGTIASASEGSSFWGMQDLDNPNGGGSFNHIIEFNSVDISSYGTVQLTFDYNAFGFDAGDDLLYQIAISTDGTDATDFGSEIFLIDGLNNGGVSTTGWDTLTLTLDSSVTNVALRLIGNQNGAGDYGGFDNVSLSAIPEPSTYAAILGGLALGMIYIRRRKQKVVA